jgi:hypothetical protein
MVVAIVAKVEVAVQPPVINEHITLLFVRYTSNRVIMHLNAIIVLISLTRINPNNVHLILFLLPDITMLLMSGFPIQEPHIISQMI